MASLEAKIEGMLAEVKGLHEALDDEKTERRRDHDVLTTYVERTKTVFKRLEGLEGREKEVGPTAEQVVNRILAVRLKPIEDERAQRVLDAREGNKEKRKVRWDLVIGILVALIGAAFGAWCEHHLFKEKPAVTIQAPK